MRMDLYYNIYGNDTLVKRASKKVYYTITEQKLFVLLYILQHYETRFMNGIHNITQNIIVMTCIRKQIFNDFVWTRYDRSRLAIKY